MPFKSSNRGASFVEFQAGIAREKQMDDIHKKELNVLCTKV